MIASSVARHPADGSLVLDYLRAIVCGHDVEREAAWIVVPGPPAAKERPRKGQGRALLHAGRDPSR